MTSIDIVSGFLGAGKTTFIQKLLGEALKTEKVVLIENEFGEIGIDGGFLKDSGIEIREMNQGCICCSLVGDFETSLSEVVEKYHPDRIIIEPSGVGKLSDIIGAVKSIAENMEVELHAAVTVVDAQKAKLYSKNFGEFFNNQIQYAGAVVLSRTDVAKEAKVTEAVEIIKALNPKATVITTPAAELSGAQLMEIISKPDDMEAEMLREVMERVKEHEEAHHHHHEDEDGECCCGHHHHEHDEDDEEHEHEHHHHHEDEEHEHHHHHDDEDGECCCGHHHHEHDEDDEDEEHEHHHHHHHEDEEHEHHHHYDEHGVCSCGHHHDEEDEEEHGHHHHDGEEIEGVHIHNHHHHHHHHHGEGEHDADEIFTSWGLETVHAFDRQKLETILSEMAESEKYGMVVRCKGMLKDAASDKWMYFDLVPEETEIREGSPEYTGKVVVIGANLNEALLKEAFVG